MNIAVIGAGNVGATLGRRWAAAGHRVVFGVRDAASAKARALREAAGSSVSLQDMPAACRTADLVVLAAPWTAVQDVLAQCGDLTGKTLIDCTNPIAAGLTGLTVGTTGSGGEEVAKWARGAAVVKTLNTTGWENMADPHYRTESATMFYCGDDAASKESVRSLLTDLGFDAVDAGALAMARYLEPLAMVWIMLARVQGHGAGIAFKLLRR